jgi:hypothetical protein
MLFSAPAGRIFRAVAAACILIALATFIAPGRCAQAERPIPETEEWFVLRKNDVPIGYAFTRLQRVRGAVPAQYRITGELVLNIALGDTELRTSTRSDETFTSSLRLVSSEWTYELGDNNIVLKANVKGDTLTYTSSRDRSAPKTTTIPYPQGCIPASLLPLYLANTKNENRNLRNILVLNTQLNGMKMERISVSEGVPGVTKFENRRVVVRNVSTRIDNIPIAMKLDTNGMVYEVSQSTIGFVQTKVGRNDLTKLGGLSRWDPLDSSIDPANVKIENPAAVKVMQVAISWHGVPPASLSLSSDMQTVVSLGGGSDDRYATLKISAQASTIGPPKPPASADNLKPYLACNATIDCDNAEVRRTAADITRHGKDPPEASRKIAAWVNRNIAPDPAAETNSGTASRTLRTRKGMSRQFATLFAALARAAGIPTRVCIGKAYVFGIFVTHYWNEVYKSGWQTVDSTQGAARPAPVFIKLAAGGTIEGVASVAAQLDASLDIEIKFFH